MDKKRNQTNGGGGGQKAIYCWQMDGVAERLCDAANPSCGELAAILGVSERTLRKWMRRHDSFRRAVEKGRKRYAEGPENSVDGGG